MLRHESAGRSDGPWPVDNARSRDSCDQTRPSHNILSMRVGPSRPMAMAGKGFPRPPELAWGVGSADQGPRAQHL